MKKVLLMLAAFATGLTLGGCDTAELADHANASPTTQEVPPDSIFQKAQERQERIDGGPYMTVIGRGLNIGEFVSSERQMRVPDTLFQSISEVRDDRITLSLPLGIDGRDVRMSMDTVSVEEGAVEEGKLFRVHVAMLPPGEPDCGMVAIVMGFYDAMWSRAAVENQALPCIRCGRVWVCGSNPTCDGN